MTGWHISPGYSGEYRSADVMNALRFEVARLRVDLDTLRAEAGEGHDEEVYTCLAHYATCTDATIQEVAGGSGPEFMLLASGGEALRPKAIARRVFIRVLMRRMHARGMDISVVVV